MQLSKNRHPPNRQNVPAYPLAPQDLKVDAHIRAILCRVNQLSLNSEENLLVASSVAAVVVERVIGPTPQNCQRPIQSFCESFVSPNGTPHGRFAPRPSHTRACLIRAPLNSHGTGSRGWAVPVPALSLTSQVPAGNCPSRTANRPPRSSESGGPMKRLHERFRSGRTGTG